MRRKLRIWEELLARYVIKLNVVDMKRLFLSLLTLFMIIGVQAQRPSVKEQMVIKQNYMNFCKDLNQQLPIQVDDYTKFYAVSFVNLTLTAYYQLDVDSDDFSENELIELHGGLRSAFKESARRMFVSGNYDLKRDEWKWFMRGTGMKFRANYKDAYDRPILSITLDYSDF